MDPCPPNIAQDDPKTPQEAVKTPQEAAKTAQDAPQDPSRAPKHLPRPPKRTQISPRWPPRVFSFFSLLLSSLLLLLLPLSLSLSLLFSLSSLTAGGSLPTGRSWSGLGWSGDLGLSSGVLDGVGAVLRQSWGGHERSWDGLDRS